jgi:hypothetical protein
VQAAKLNVIDNPWSHPFAEAPFVLPGDGEVVEAFNKKLRRRPNRYLQVKTHLPEPFVGDPEAPVVLLSNNPGFGKKRKLRKTPDFMERMRNNLRLQKAKYPFIYLDPKLSEIGEWWKHKLKCLTNDCGLEIVARSVLNVAYFPYPSKRFGRKSPELSSQHFGFDLVRAAIDRGAIIVLMRKGKRELWTSKVPELESYDGFVVLKNPQNPSISPKNCRKGDYEKIVAAIKAVETKK